MSTNHRRGVGRWSMHRRLGPSVAVMLFAAAGTAARSEGFEAFAVGTCDRLGFTTGYDNAEKARASAIEACASNGDKTCRIVLVIQEGCAAFAVSGPCGARGWANAATLGQAEEAAVARCSLRGGRNCTVKKSICSGDK
jgi:hypothetical protein